MQFVVSFQTYIVSSINLPKSKWKYVNSIGIQIFFVILKLLFNAVLVKWSIPSKLFIIFKTVIRICNDPFILMIIWKYFATWLDINKRQKFIWSKTIKLDFYFTDRNLTKCLGRSSFWITFEANKSKFQLLK